MILYLVWVNDFRNSFWVWISDGKKIIFKDIIGVFLYCVEVLCSDLYIDRGFYIVNNESELIYIDKYYNVNKFLNDLIIIIKFINKLDFVWIL